MTKPKNNNKTYFFLVFAMICWGLSFVWYKQALENFRPVTLVLFRLIISLPLLLIAAVVLKRLKKVQINDIPIFFLLAFFEPFIYFMGESNGMLYVSSTVASIIIATIPLFTSIIAYLFINEKLSVNNYIGMVLSFAGVVAVIFSDDSNLTATGKGIGLIFVAVFGAVAYGLIIKKIADRYNTLTIVTVQNLIGAIYFIPVFLITDLQDFKALTLSFDMLIPVLYLSFFASTLAYVGFIEGLRVLGVAKATVFANFIPVFTAIFAFFIIDEPISLKKVGGILLVVLGLILSQATKRINRNKSKNIVIDELY